MTEKRDKNKNKPQKETPPPRIIKNPSKDEKEKK